METYIEPYELYHYGVRGMKWGVRRYQNKDGSLTAAGEKRYNKAVETMNDSTKSTRSRERAKKTVEKLGGAKKATEEKETVEEKRSRLLKSTDAKELYENRDLLSTNELNERINRIDTEARLKSKIIEDNEKTGMDYVNDKMRTTTQTINNASNFFKSVDGAYSAVANSAIGKTLAKQLGIETPKKAFDYEDFLKNIGKKTTQEIMDANKRLTAEESIRNKMKSRASDAQSSSQSGNASTSNATSTNTNRNSQSDSGSSNSGGSNTSQTNNQSSSSSTSSSSRQTSNSSNASDDARTYTGTVEGSGTSRFGGWDRNARTVDAEEGRDYWSVNDSVKTSSASSAFNSSTARIGQNYVAPLEDRDRR